MKHRVLGRAVGALMALPTLTSVAIAQEREADAGPEEVVVTGSRIRQPEATISAPIVAMESEAIRYSGKTNLTELLKELPALTGSTDSNDAAGPNAFIGGTGLTLLDLRNLGEDRTLVLVNGRRHVSSLPGSAAVDVETIPISLIERVEVQTGGASAIYGADGVSGVVNFIMRERFEGFESSLQYGRSSRGDADTRLASVIAGKNFLDAEANVTVAFEYATEDRLNQNQRRYTRSANRYLFVGNPNDPDDVPGVPDEIPVTDIGYWDSSPGGAIYLNDGDNLADFNGRGLPYNYGTIEPTDGAPFPTIYQQGGDATRVASYVGDLLPEKERYTLNVLSDLQLADAARVFGEFKYSRTEAFTLSQPTFDFFLRMRPDNPYIPASIANAAAGSSVFLSRDHFDLGTRYEEVTRETLRGVVGLDGDITDNVRYEVSYVYGETESKVENLERIEDRFAAAIDVVRDPLSGQPVCRSNLVPSTAAGAETFTPGPNSGCVPISLFGENAISAAGADWVMTDTVGRSKIAQYVAQAYVSGTSEDLFSLPAGGLGFAVGAEWRKETSKNTPPIENQLGLVFGNVLNPDRGSYDVAEAFTEVTIPLLRDQPFAEILSIDGAYRMSDYSTTGSASTWKTGFIWSPLRDITFRGTLAEATRAPNIGELFDPGGQTFEQISDPCDATNVDEGSANRAANCAALLSALGVDTSVPYQDQNTAFVGGTLTGNRNLKEEVAKTKTIGVVLRPSFAPTLSIAIDWYDIELSDAINTADPEQAAEICVDSASIDNPFCDLLTREAGTGTIVDFIQQPQNVAKFTTEGYDFTIAYGFEAGDVGNFAVRAVGNKLEELTFIRLPNADPDIALGEADEDAPEWQVNFDLTWQRGIYSVNYGINYFDETLRYEHSQLAADPDLVDPRYRYYDAQFTHDLQGRIELESGLSMYAGVNNLTDQEPDTGADAYPVSPLGRYFYAGLSFRGF